MTAFSNEFIVANGICQQLVDTVVNAPSRTTHPAERGCPQPQQLTKVNPAPFISRRFA
jgi:hypothetical protein